MLVLGHEPEGQEVEYTVAATGVGDLEVVEECHAGGVVQEVENEEGYQDQRYDHLYQNHEG